MAGASGFLQAAFRFCASFGMRGVFNFGATVGETTSVAEEESRKADQGKTRMIGMCAILIAAGVAAAGLLTA